MSSVGKQSYSKLSEKKASVPVYLARAYIDWHLVIPSQNLHDLVLLQL